MRTRYTRFVGACAIGSVCVAADLPVLTLAQTIPLPGVEGRIDHLAVDVAGQRVFVAALGNNSIEIINLAAGKHVGSIQEVKEPQGIRFVDGLLFVGSGEGGTCDVFEAASHKRLASVKLGDDADNVRYDPEPKRIYVGYGQGALAVIDAVKRAKITDIPLKAHPESFQLETRGTRIFVNVPKAMQIAVIDRSKDQVIATWPIHEAHDNFPMALDESHQRLFVGCRKPARLLVLETRSGKVTASSDCGADTDDLFYDSASERVYLSCGAGSVDVFDVTGTRPIRIQQLPDRNRSQNLVVCP